MTIKPIEQHYLINGFKFIKYTGDTHSIRPGNNNYMQLDFNKSKLDVLRKFRDSLDEYITFVEFCEDESNLQSK